MCDGSNCRTSTTAGHPNTNDPVVNQSTLIELRKLVEAQRAIFDQLRAIRMLLEGEVKELDRRRI